MSVTDQTAIPEEAASPQREELSAPLPPLKIRDLVIDPAVLPAPMCGISDRPWRLFAREQGCDLVYTQMVSCEAMTRSGKGRLKSWSILDMFMEEGPVCAQLFGSDPENLAATAEDLVKAGAAIVDLNMGCPVNKVVNTNSGSALMTQPALVRHIFKTIRRRVPVPFTVKFRAGWERFGEEAFTIARIAEEEGLDAVAVHARTRKQGYKGKADWSIIKSLKEKVSIPVIGNGDVKNADDAVRMVRDFNADAVMIGRGCMGNPWIFREIVARFRCEPDPPAPTVKERIEAVMRHAELMAMRKGEDIGLREFRKHVVQYMKGFPHARELKTQLMGALTLKDYETILGEGLRQIEARENEDWKKDLEGRFDQDDPTAFHFGSCQDC